MKSSDLVDFSLTKNKKGRFALNVIGFGNAFLLPAPAVAPAASVPSSLTSMYAS